MKSPRFISSVLSALLACIAPTVFGDGLSTAWHDGKFNVDVQGVVSHSNIVLGQPNSLTTQAMPLGNGRLGVAIWAANGLTAQLNRADTMPKRLSPGQLVIPGLAKLTAAADYKGLLDLYNGELVESGGGMTATARVDAENDLLVIDVAGADPNVEQTVQLNLWSPRTPQAIAWNQGALLAETWIDSQNPGGTGETFGSLAAISVNGRNVKSAVITGLTVAITFRPNADGSFGVLVASPEWKGGDAQAAATQLFKSASRELADGTRDWWHRFWNRIGLMKLRSKDGSAEYFENLRTIDLYISAAENRGKFPGSQAGVADLFSSIQDFHQWDPADFWHWNIRMQVAANLGAGAPELNEPYFNLYRGNYFALQDWTKVHMNGRAGIVVPEVMRFNGQGYENDFTGFHLAADSSIAPFYNARTLTTGAEISLWAWQQYLATDDFEFLSQMYPFIRESAVFLLAYAQNFGAQLHTFPSNAHETQWDVHDPTTDIAAMQSLFPVVVDAADTLQRDSEIVRQLENALPQVLPFPRTDQATQTKLLGPNDPSGADVIAPSYDPAANKNNVENIGLEPVWPYSTISDTGPLFALALRTYANRPYKTTNDWSSDPIQAARLGLSQEVSSTLLSLTQQFQKFPNGLAQFFGPEFYGEQIGVVADALQEALVQDFDGLLRIAPAWPADWSADGSVFVQHGTKVDVQIRGGIPVTVAIEAGYSGLLRIRNPWPGQAVQVVLGSGWFPIISSSQDSIINFPISRGQTYIVQQTLTPIYSLPFQAVTSSPATAYKALGTNTIGLPSTH